MADVEYVTAPRPRAEVIHSLRNASAHSCAVSVDIEPEYRRDVVLPVSVDGVGTPVYFIESGKPDRRGSTRMRERAANVGATPTVDVPGSGTRHRTDRRRSSSIAALIEWSTHHQVRPRLPMTHSRLAATEGIRVAPLDEVDSARLENQPFDVLLALGATSMLRHA